MTGSRREAGLGSEFKLGPKIASMYLPTHLVIHNFFSQAGRHHLLQRLLFALCLPRQLRRAVTKPRYVILEQQQRHPAGINARRSRNERAMPSTTHHVLNRVKIIRHLPSYVLSGPVPS